MAATNDTYQALMKDAIRQIQELKAALAAKDAHATEPIAIIGMACRFPDADSLDAYWNLLCSGGDAVREIPADRWDVGAYYDEDGAGDAKMYTRHIAAIDQVYAFDPKFFKISPRVAETIDPQQRLLLEVSWEALENAGIAPDALRHSSTGVFVGLTANDFTLHCTQISSNSETGVGGSHGIAAGRIAYILGLQGPVMHLDTTCSSSLVATHLACQSLRTGESNLALVGGAHLILSPLSMSALCQMKALSRDGRCKAFDASADGFGRGEGCGMIVLKRLSDARRDNDKILALIRGSAINHDGPSSRLTAPNQQAQEKLLKQALHNARVNPDAVSYIEAHGTGTPLGDPVELHALHKVFSQRKTPLWVGSVKTNIGHLEAAAGVAGLIKTVLALQHGFIPPHLHFHQPTAHFDWQSTPIQVPTTVVPWPANPTRSQSASQRIAGVSAFGFSGTNAHVILEEAPSKPVQPVAHERSWHLLTLSAKSEDALKMLVTRYSEFLARDGQVSLGDLCYTANVGRTHFQHRLSAIAKTHDEMRNALLACGDNETPASALYGRVPEYQPPPKVAFLFTAQGALYAKMGRELYTTQPTFRQTFDHCDALAQQFIPGSLVTILYSDSALEHHSGQTDFRDFTYFAVAYALVALWKAWGVKPDLVLGEGVGEVVAACTAELFGVEHGIKLVAAAMGLTPQPFHQVLQEIPYAPPLLPLISSRGGGVVQAEIGTADYWLNYNKPANHFDAGLKTLLQQHVDIYLEMGPPSPFVEKVNQFLDKKEISGGENSRQQGRHTNGLSPNQTQSPILLASLQQGKSDWQQLLTCLGALYRRGVPVNWIGFDRDYDRHKVVLPNYPFQHQSYWVTSPDSQPQGSLSNPLLRLLDQGNIEQVRRHLLTTGGLSEDEQQLVTRFLNLLIEQHPNQL